MPDHPPCAAERFLRWLVPGRDGEIIAGDLREHFSHRGGGTLWYWLQTLSCVRVRLSPYRRAIPDLHQDLHYALRLIRRNPGYAIAAMLCLALGIGVNSTVFSLIDGLYFRTLPVPQPDRIVAIDRYGKLPIFWRDYHRFADVPAFTGVTAAIATSTYMDIERENLTIQAEAISGNYADVLQVKPALGRWITPNDATAGAEPVAVIATHIWDAHFQRSPNAIGKFVRIENQEYRIVGVAPEEFRGVSPPVLVDAWLPFVTYPVYRDELKDPRNPGQPVTLTARLKQGETVEHANAQIAVINARLRQDHPRAPDYATPLTLHPFRGIPSADGRRMIRAVTALLLATVVIVLLIACVNVANLLLSRAAVRRREMAVRRSLGASRFRLLRQGLAESLILAAGGAALGLLLGAWTNRILSSWLPASVPLDALRGVYLELNWRVGAFTAVTALICAILFSLAPALEGSSVDLLHALKMEAGTGRDGKVRRWGQRDFYVVAQVALSLVLLITAGLLLRALQRTMSIDPGFATDHQAYIRLFTPEPDFTPESSARAFTRILHQAREIPGVQQATLSFAMFGFMDSDCVSANRASTEEHLNLNVVEPNYFQMMRIPLLRGRNFNDYDLPRSPRAVVINETLARQWWPGENPMDKTIWMGCGRETPRVAARVIGVAKDSKYGTLDEEPRPFLYLSRHQVWWNGFFALIARTPGDPHRLTQPLIQLARSGGPNLRIYEVRTVDDLISRSLWQVRWQASLLAAFGLLAIALSAIGLYGVVAYTVARRTREIGVRMALGAQRSDVQWMVLARGLRLTAIGVAAGLALSAGSTRFLRSFLYGVDPLDPLAFTGAAAVWILIAMLASYIPAQRAARVDPAISLRYD